VRAAAALLAALTVATWTTPGGAAVPAPASAETLTPLDEFPPPPVAPLPPARWIGRNEFPLTIPVEASSPPPSQPASAIAGYAYSASLRPGEAPCADRELCTESETVPDLGGAFSLPAAPEGGAVWLRVVAVSGAGLSSPVPGEATLQVDLTDPTTRLAGLPAGWTRSPVRLRATATDRYSGMAGERAFTAIRVDGGTPRAAPGPAVEASVIEEGVHRVAYYAGDSAGNADDGAWVNGHRNPPPGARTVRIDRTPPRAGFLPQSPLDPELIRVRVRDALSGPDASGGWIGIRPAASVERFRRLPAAPGGGGELRARWDSAAYPPGAYVFRAEVRDAAGNTASTTRREGGAPMLLANPLKTTTSLSAGFGGRVLHWHRCRRRGKRRVCRRQTIADFSRRPARRTVPYGRGLPISGKLVAGPSGAPGPRPVRVVERFARGARRVARATTVSTGPDGSFTARLAPGPSREVTASYAGGRTLAASAGRTLRLQVRSGVRLRASSPVARVGGAPLVLRGKVRAQWGEIPPDGLTVRLDFRLPGRGWEEFRAVRTNRRGRFRLAYRFSDDDSRGARFRFRAHVPAQANWPYSPGNSHPIFIKGL
jgi:hypothetical protein